MVETLTDLAIYTSCHGVNHIATSEKLWMKLMWLGIVVAMFGVVIINTVQFVNQYNSDPVLVKSEINHDKLKFPAVTFCNLNAIRKSQIDKVPALKNLFSLCDLKLDKKDVSPSSKSSTMTTTNAPAVGGGRRKGPNPICEKYAQRLKEQQQSERQDRKENSSNTQ
uniref:Uncharacterized protein n=1 Tax=Romanomermis culicivorax TaxID=13658 RepID=A0A915HPG1_ROMCU